MAALKVFGHKLVLGMAISFGYCIVCVVRSFPTEYSINSFKFPEFSCDQMIFVALPIKLVKLNNNTTVHLKLT